MMMNEFPGFMRNPANRIKQGSQYTDGIEGYVFDGADGSQMAFWTCSRDRESREHAHDYDEYLTVVQGSYTIIMQGKETVVEPGQESFIPGGTLHGGRMTAGTRTIHCFGGRRAERESKQRMR